MRTRSTIATLHPRRCQAIHTRSRRQRPARGRSRKLFVLVLQYQRAGVSISLLLPCPDGLACSKSLPAAAQQAPRSTRAATLATAGPILCRKHSRPTCSALVKESSADKTALSLGVSPEAAAISAPYSHWQSSGAVRDLLPVGHTYCPNKSTSLAKTS